MIEAFPLHWPLPQPRTAASDRKRANFSVKGTQSGTFGSYQVKKQVTMAEATNRVLRQLDAYTRTGQPWRVPKESIVISTNVPVRKDGLPYSGYKQPADPGAAVYFKLDGRDYCFPCDRWDRVEDNLAAIAAHIDAMRGIERWGVGQTHDAYQGYKALPEQSMSEAKVWAALGLSSKPTTLDQVKAAYRQRLQIAHPDKPTGSEAAFLELQQAYAFATQLFNQ